MSYFKGKKKSETIPITLRKPEGSFSKKLCLILGTPGYCDLYVDNNEVRCKWYRALTNGERLKLINLLDDVNYSSYIIDKDLLFKGEPIVVIKTRVNPDLI